MRIQDHLAKLSWTAADKVLFILYGFVSLVQMRDLPTAELGLYALFNVAQTFIATFSDNSVLQTLIMFGADKAQRGGVNRFALIWHSTIMLGAALLFFAAQTPLTALFHEPRLAAVAGYVPLMCLVMIPRTYCLKLLFRDVQMRDVFLVNATWFGTMAALTAYLLIFQQLRTFESMAFIAIVGVGASALVAIWRTRKLLVFAGTTTIDRSSLASFGFYQSLIGITGNVVRQLDFYLVQYFFGAATVGIYSSARTLFRPFDEAVNGIVGFFYPGAVRLVAEQRNEELLAFISKSLSFMLVTILAVTLVLELGVADVLVTTLLPARFHPALGYFKLLIFTAPILPFTLLPAVILAFGEPPRLLGYVLAAVGAGVGTLIVIGMLGEQAFVPFGIGAYYLVLGGLCFVFVKRRTQFPLHLLLRAIPDTLNFLRSKR